MSQTLVVTDKWVVKWLHFFLNGQPSLVSSIDNHPVFNIIVTQALEITNSICFSGTPTAFGIKHKILPKEDCVFLLDD